MTKLSRSEGLRILPFLDTEEGPILAFSQKKRSINGMNDAVETVASKVVTNDRPQGNRKPGVYISYRPRQYSEASFAMVVLFVERLGIPVGHMPASLIHSDSAPTCCERQAMDSAPKTADHSLSSPSLQLKRHAP